MLFQCEVLTINPRLVVVTKLTVFPARQDTGPDDPSIGKELMQSPKLCAQEQKQFVLSGSTNVIRSHLH